MKLFDGSAEYVRADELKAGDEVRAEGAWRTVLEVERGVGQTRVVYEDGFGYTCPAETRELRRIK